VKVVLDTNVLLAAFATRGLCESILDLCLDQHQIVLSEAILAEAKEHLARKFKVPASQIQEIVALLREHSVIVEPTAVPPNACRDPDDLSILGTLLAGGADCLVTGDKDLLVIKQFRNIPIMSPRQFYDSLRS
jgi:uncharacterized protein